MSGGQQDGLAAVGPAGPAGGRVPVRRRRRDQHSGRDGGDGKAGPRGHEGTGREKTGRENTGARSAGRRELAVIARPGDGLAEHARQITAVAPRVGVLRQPLKAGRPSLTVVIGSSVTFIAYSPEVVEGAEP